jgi:DNA-binding LacI/PurR family transcriptional regulator
MPAAVAAGPSRLGFFMEIAAAAALTATSHALALCLAPPQPDFDFDSIEVDGAILIEPMENDRLLEHFLRRNVPVASIGRAPGHDDVPWIDMQSAATTELLLDHLWREGGRIGLIIGEQRRNSYIEAEAVYAAFAAKHGFSPLAVRVDEAGGEAAARDAALRLLESYPNIDALCVPVDAFAIGVLDAARGIGRSVPNTLRVATRYDGVRAKLAAPQLTAVNLRLDQIAEAAVELLIAAFEGTETQHPPMPKPELIARASSAAPR